MILLDTDTFSLLVAGHARVVARLRSTEDDAAVTVITRIEVLQGRFDALLKAAGAEQLQRAQQRLERSERDLAELKVVPIDASAAGEFDRLRQNKKLKKIGRGDLLIAAIALANRATLATRNQRDFRQVPGLRLENWAD